MHKEAITEWGQMFAVSGYEKDYGLAAALRRGYDKSGYEGALREVLKKPEAPPREVHVPPRVDGAVLSELGR